MKAAAPRWSAALLLIAVAGPVVAAILCWGRAGIPVLMALVLIPVPAVLAIAAPLDRDNWSGAPRPREDAGFEPAARYWVKRFRYAAASAGVGIWLLVAIALAQAAAGGTFWL